MSKLKQVNQSGYNKGYLAGKRDSADRIEVLQHEVDMWRKHVVELEAELTQERKDLHEAWDLYQAAKAKLDAVEATLKRISEVEPIGDSGYKYGYAWERCVTIAVLALEG